MENEVVRVEGEAVFYNAAECLRAVERITLEISRKGGNRSRSRSRSSERKWSAVLPTEHERRAMRVWR